MFQQPYLVVSEILELFVLCPGSPQQLPVGLAADQLAAHFIMIHLALGLFNLIIAKNITSQPSD